MPVYTIGLFSLVVSFMSSPKECWEYNYLQKLLNLRKYFTKCHSLLNKGLAQYFMSFHSSDRAVVFAIVYIKPSFF